MVDGSRVSARRVVPQLGAGVMGLCLAGLVAACGFPRLAELGDGGGGRDDGTNDGGPPPLDLELLAGQTGGAGNVDGTGAAARFNTPTGVAVDSAGNVYVADQANHTIRKVTPAGGVTTLAGTAGTSGSADGTGAAARFNFPAGVAVDSAGNVYVADAGNDTIRVVTATGGVTTLAGTPGMAGSADGTGAAARFKGPTGVAVDGAGNLYVADTGNHTVRKVTAAGVVTTLAGTASMAGSADGAGAAARFKQPFGVAVDSAGNVYVADTGNGIIRKVTAAGVVTTMAGTAGVTGYADGSGAAARFNGPIGVTADGAGNVYVADQGNCIIRKVTADGVVTTLAGNLIPGSADGTGAAAQFFFPQGVAVDSAGNIYVADRDNCIIRKVTADRVVTTLAGTPRMGASVDGAAAAARFNFPFGVAVDLTGNVYVADESSTIRKISTDGVVTTLAGTANSVGGVDGTGAAARFNAPFGVTVDGAGNVYVADTFNSTIRKVTADRVVTTLAGTAGMAGGADGTGAVARFNEPQGVAVDSAGNIYVADTNNSTLRKVTPDGIVTTLAGTAGMAGGADGGTAARFNLPEGVAVDGTGSIYVADTLNHTLRKVTAGGVVTTLAGTAGMAGGADGTGAAARFHFPSGVAVDSAGNVYVADSGNSTIRKVTPTGTTTTVAGTAGLAGILLGAAPRFAFPAGLAIVGDSIVISDNNAILLLRHGARP